MPPKKSMTKISVTNKKVSEMFQMFQEMKDRMGEMEELLEAQYERSNKLEYEVSKLKESDKEKKETITKLKTYVNRLRRKIPILQKINSEPIPEKTFNEWVAEFEVTRSDFESVIVSSTIKNKSLKHGIFELFIKMFPLDEFDKHAFRIYDKNNNNCYVVSKDKETNKNIWVKKSKSIIVGKLIKHLLGLLWDVYDNWKDENIEKIAMRGTEEYEDDCRYRKVIIGGVSDDEIIRHNKPELTKYLMRTLKSQIIYEYED